jgi:hypothetical protein
MAAEKAIVALHARLGPPNVAKHGRVLDLVTRALQQGQSSLHFLQLVKTGSFGKGTMLDLSFEGGEDKSDVDIVLVLDKITPQQHRDQLEEKLALLKSILESTRPAIPELKWRKSTPHAVRFSVEGIHVDLLPAPAISDTEAIPESLWKHTTVCFAQKQLDFVKGQSDEVKKYIRLAKFWKTRFVWPRGRGKVSSYFLELLAISVVGLHKPQGPVQFATHLLNILANVETLSVDLEGFGAQIPEPVKRLPFLGDPANRFNNVASFLYDAEILRSVKLAAKQHSLAAFSAKFRAIVV